MYKPLIVLIALILMLSFSFADLTTNLEAYYSMDETSGTTMIDDTGTINGTLIGGLPTTSNGLIDRGYGVFSNGKYAQISPPASMQFSDSTSFSVCSWLKGTLTHYEGIEKVVDACGVLTWQLIPAANGYTKFRMTRDCGGSNTITSSVAATTTDWYMVCSTYDGSTKAMILYQDGVNRGSTTFGTTASASSGVIQIGRNPRFGDYYDGYYDEVGIWSRVLTPTEITELYNSGDGFTYPFTEGVDANFGYVIDKTNAQVILTDTSPTFGATSITSWTWKNGDTNIGFTKDFNYPTTQLTDLNIGLYVDTNNDLNDIQYYAFNTGEWTAPVTTFSSHQVTGTTDQNIILTCTDNNSGCKYINYNIDANVWIQKTYTDANRIFTYPGGGVHSIQYFSTDNADNNETTKTSQFTTYGIANFGFYDENNLAELDGITYTISPSINGNSGATLIDNNLDLNLQGLTSGTYTFTFTLTDYGTRYYITDLNQYSDITIGFTLLPESLGRNIEFQVYKTDKTTLYTNTYIEMLLNDQNYNSIGRRKTDSLGKITFFVNPNDPNYTMRIYGADGTVDYNSMTLTVNKPKSESSGSAIDGNWSLKVTGLAWQTYTDLTGSQAIQIYANTIDTYGLTVGDTLSSYYDRKYYVSYLGGTTAETLQPYLVDINSAVSTTVYTISGYSQQPVGGITLKIYKTIPAVGRVLVEQVVTDSKGEALISLIANDEYEFEIYDNGTLLGSQAYSVTSTSTTIYITVDDLGLTGAILGEGLVTVKFTPTRGKIIGNDVSLIQKISVTDRNYGITFVSAYIYVVNTDVNGVAGSNVTVWSKTITSLTNTIVLDNTLQTLDGNWFDTNGYIIVYVQVTTNKGIYYTQYKYKPQVGFDFYKAIGFDLRPSFGCPVTTDPLIPCGSMLFIAIFISIIITIGFAIETGFTGAEGMAGIFLVVMGLFTYFAWVPLGIMAIMAVSVIMLMIAIGGKNRL